MSILVTGGTGFIGSHTSLLLLEKGFNLYIIDSEVNSSKNVLKKITLLLKMTDEEFKSKINFFHGDLRDINFIEKVFCEASKKNEPIQSVFHFAGLKSVFESIKYPIKYWDNNVLGTINLLKIMKNNDCKNLIFSSSATIYKTIKRTKSKNVLKRSY